MIDKNERIIYLVLLQCVVILYNNVMRDKSIVRDYIHW